MSKVLKDSLVRKNRHMFKTALNAVERVMGQDFRETEKFNAIRNLILNAGNEIERSIKSELDQYAIVLKDGSPPAATTAGEYIRQVLPNIEFSRVDSVRGNVPRMKIKLCDKDGDLSLLREILNCGIVSCDRQGYPVFDAVGVADCLKLIPVMNEVLYNAPPKYRQIYNQWVQGVYSDYKVIGV